MAQFATNTTLPRYLRIEQEKVEKVARRYGLDFFPVIFEMLSYDQMNEIAAYGGFPNRYPHWRFGMEYERLSKSYEYGLSKIYEMVINNNPSFAYLLEGNSLTDQKLVMCHVFGHVDFFKNNFAFRSTDLDAGDTITDPVRRHGEAYTPNRKWVDKMANHGAAVRRIVDRFGIAKVEEFIDVCLSLENLIDPWSRFVVRRRESQPDEEPNEVEVPRLRAKDYMEEFINPSEYIEEQKKKIGQRERRVHLDGACFYDCLLDFTCCPNFFASLRMKIFLNVIGILLTLGAALVVLKSFLLWRGFLRGGILLFVLGFAFFAFGFAFRIFESSPNFDLIFFAAGAAFLLIGAKKVFSLNPSGLNK